MSRNALFLVEQYKELPNRTCRRCRPEHAASPRGRTIPIFSSIPLYTELSNFIFIFLLSYPCFGGKKVFTFLHNIRACVYADKRRRCGCLRYTHNTCAPRERERVDASTYTHPYNFFEKLNANSINLHFIYRWRFQCRYYTGRNIFTNGNLTAQKLLREIAANVHVRP